MCRWGGSRTGEYLLRSDVGSLLDILTGAWRSLRYCQKTHRVRADQDGNPGGVDPAALREPSATAGHLGRFVGAVDSDQHLVVSTAKALIESTAKGMAAARSVEYASPVNLPVLVSQAQAALSLWTVLTFVGTGQDVVFHRGTNRPRASGDSSCVREAVLPGAVRAENADHLIDVQRAGQPSRHRSGRDRIGAGAVCRRA